MGTSDFDAVRIGSTSDPDPAGAMFPEKAGDGVLRDHDLDVAVCEIDVLSSELAVLAPAGDSIDPVLWPSCLERVQADFEVFDRLVDSDVKGEPWEQIVEALDAYASGVLDPWIRTGVIYAQTSHRLLGVPDWPAGRDRLACDQNYREEMIAHIVVRAMEKLQKGLRAGTGWNPRKGLSLASYFVTGCLHEFVYLFKKEHRWWTTHQCELDDSSDELIGSAGLWDSRLGADPADIVISRMIVLEHLAALSPVDRTALWANLSGYSNAEIAHLLQVTTKAVERRLHRLRQKARQSVRSLG
ncbi:sigma factor-like helix-turn-helix DNA-binding protein [Nocardia sp. NBC_00416]|uniref:sigma factor-like helix-turn-helix DNA-binding protein n=1 Tax=Nocardia sp. NBC_00416 TaxID=2975991 RepID=UPI002E1D18A1